MRHPYPQPPLRPDQLEDSWRKSALTACYKGVQHFERTKMSPGWKDLMLATMKGAIMGLIQRGDFHPDPSEFFRRTLLCFQIGQHHHDIKIIVDHPKFEHDCDKCEFYGCVDFCDLWYCPTARPVPTMIVRRSADPADYISGGRSYATGPELEMAWGIKESVTRISWP